MVQSSKWIPPLDGLRGAAILMVICFHYRTTLGRTGGVTHVFRGFCEIGWTGVDLFFVLSGFLITGILLDSRGAKNYFSAFYMRRVLRIFPLYYLSLAVVFGLAIPLLTPDRAVPAIKTQLPYFMYVQNWDGFFHRAQYQSFLSHYWSLAVEEQFYLAWPVIVYTFDRRKLMQIISGAFVAAIGIRLILVLAGVNPELIYRNTFARMDALFAGAACACALREPRVTELLDRYFNRLWITALVVLALLRIYAGTSSNTSTSMQTFGYSFIALSYAGLVVTVVSSVQRHSLLREIFASVPLTTLGRYSYGAYVWHLLVARLLQTGVYSHFPALVSPVRIPMGILATLILSIASYRLVESPFLGLKTYFVPRVERAMDSPAPDTVRR
ncbi:MAG: acyltransferase [Bryobacterales bacterium]|nr:acyltransferase [Bryobacterales bacterium]